MNGPGQAAHGDGWDSVRAPAPGGATPTAPDAARSLADGWLTGHALTGHALAGGAPSGRGEGAGASRAVTAAAGALRGR